MDRGMRYMLAIQCSNPLRYEAVQRQGSVGRQARCQRQVSEAEAAALRWEHPAAGAAPACAGSRCRGCSGGGRRCSMPLRSASAWMLQALVRAPGRRPASHADKGGVGEEDADELSSQITSHVALPHRQAHQPATEARGEERAGGLAAAPTCWLIRQQAQRRYMQRDGGTMRQGTMAPCTRAAAGPCRLGAQLRHPRPAHQLHRMPAGGSSDACGVSLVAAAPEQRLCRRGRQVPHRRARAPQSLHRGASHLCTAWRQSWKQFSCAPACVAGQAGRQAFSRQPAPHSHLAQPYSARRLPCSHPAFPHSLACTPHACTRRRQPTHSITKSDRPL